MAYPCVPEEGHRKSDRPLSKAGIAQELELKEEAMGEYQHFWYSVCVVPDISTLNGLPLF